MSLKPVIAGQGFYDKPPAGSGGAPSGSAGGDLSGSYPNPAVAKIGGVAATAFFKTLVDDADAATLRATIGAGTSSFSGVFADLSGIPTTLAGYGITDAQPLNAANLSPIAALTTTAYGRGILEVADAAAARTYIGAGTSSITGSTGGNGATDSGKALLFGASGDGFLTAQLKVKDSAIGLPYWLMDANGITRHTGLSNKTVLAFETGTSSLDVVTLKAGVTGNLVTTGDTGTVTSAMLAGSIAPSKITGTAAILGANAFTALQTITQASANAGILASTGYSLTGSDATNMIDLAGTWNTSGSPTGIKLDMTITAAGAAARMLDLQSSGTSAFSVEANASGNGKIWLGKRGAFISTLNDYYFELIGYFGFLIKQDSGGLTKVPSGIAIASSDVRLWRETSGHLTIRDDTNPLIFSISNTWTSTTNFERFKVDWSSTSNICRIGTSKGGGGGSSRELHIEVGDSAVIKLGTAGEIGFYGAAAVAQATTGIAAATFAANTSLIADDSATWDGYTAGQVVKALRNIGILA